MSRGGGVPSAVIAVVVVCSGGKSCNYCIVRVVVTVTFLVGAGVIEFF